MLVLISDNIANVNMILLSAWGYVHNIAAAEVHPVLGKLASNVFIRLNFDQSF